MPINRNTNEEETYREMYYTLLSKVMNIYEDFKSIQIEAVDTFVTPDEIENNRQKKEQL